MHDFRVAFIWTAVVLSILSAMSMAGVAVGAFYWFWFICVIVWIVGLLVGLGMLLFGRRRLAGGILAGLGIGVLVLAATGLVNMVTVVVA